MLKKMKFYLFSSNYKLAQKLYYIGNLKAIYLEKKHFNQNIFNFASLKKIELHDVESIKELEDVLPKELQDNAIGISYGVGFFFKNRHIELFEHGIWNIHTGKLPDNRGRHPISWSFINNDDYFYLTIHQINEQLDQGKLIHEKRFERDINDTQTTILRKVENILETGFLESAIEKYFKNELKLLEKGTYNKSLAGRFDNIDPSEFSARELFSIFKSQIYFGPVCVLGERYICCDFYSDLISYKNSRIFECKDGIKLIMGKQK